VLPSVDIVCSYFGRNGGKVQNLHIPNDYVVHHLCSVKWLHPYFELVRLRFNFLEQLFRFVIILIVINFVWSISKSGKVRWWSSHGS
jgi:hypothetical protein